MPDLGLTQLSESQRRRILDLLPLDDLPGTPRAAAVYLMHWVSRQWEHDGWNDPGTNDPAAILERGMEGEQFRCVEYGVVVAGALAAVGMPSRSVSLRQPRYWEPLAGKGHVGVEVWLDDLGRWVFLDPQLGGWWEVEGRMLNVGELIARNRGDLGACTFTGRFGEVGTDWLAITGHSSSAAYWWDCFAHASVGGIFLLDGEDYHATFQQMCASRADLALHPDQHGWAYPDLACVSIQAPADPHGALRLKTLHPHATGFAVNGESISLDVPLISLDLGEGEHHANIAVVTRWGELTASRLQWTVGPLLAPLAAPHEV